MPFNLSDTLATTADAIPLTTQPEKVPGAWQSVTALPTNTNHLRVGQIFGLPDGTFRRWTGTTFAVHTIATLPAVSKRFPSQSAFVAAGTTEFAATTKTWADGELIEIDNQPGHAVWNSTAGNGWTRRINGYAFNLTADSQVARYLTDLSPLAGNNGDLGILGSKVYRKVSGGWVFDRDTATGATSVTPERATVVPRFSHTMTRPNGEYGNTTISHSRASVAWYPDEQGVLRPAASGQIIQDSRGTLKLGAATNALTVASFNPVVDANTTVTGTGTLTVVSDVEGLTRDGLHIACWRGQVYELVNTSGSNVTLTFAQNADNTNACAFQIRAKATGECTLQLTGGQGAEPIPASDRYLLVKNESVTHSAGTDRLQLVIPTGVRIRYILPQIEFAASGSMRQATYPIESTAGAAGTRAQTQISFPVTNMPADTSRMVWAFEIMGISEVTNNDLYVTATTSPTEAVAVWRNNFRTVSGGVTTSVANSHFCPLTRRHTRLAYRWSAALGMAQFIDGIKGYNAPTTPPAAWPTITAALQIGYSSTFGGTDGDFWIRNFAIYDQDLDDDTCKALTARTDYSVTAIPGLGVVHLDRDSKRLWALRMSGVTANTFDQIVYSDDKGETWPVFASIAANPSVYPWLHMDQRGNFYWTNAGSSGLCRYDRVAETVSTPLSMFPATHSGNIQDWQFCTLANGGILVSFYSQSNTVQLQNQYLFYSASNGVTWQRFDGLVTNYTTQRHVHSIRQGYDGSILVTIGDTAAGRKTLRSTNIFGLTGSGSPVAGVLNTDWTEITVPGNTANNGMTGLVGTVEGWLAATDNTDNIVFAMRYGDTAFRQVWKPQNPLQLTPIFNLISLTKNTAVLCLTYDNVAIAQFSVLAYLSKDDGIYSPWVLDDVLYWLPKEGGTDPLAGSLISPSSAGDQTYDPDMPLFVVHRQTNDYLGAYRINK